MTAQMPPFPVLDRTQQQIRLLRRQPGGVFEFDTFCLDQAPKYCTLSYAWYEATDEEPLLRDVQIKHCNDSWIQPIHYNLWTFLQQHESLPEDCKYLWVDCLCINQRDIRELTHQVRFMDQIYATCEAVIVWLGPIRPSHAQYWTAGPSPEPDFWEFYSWFMKLKRRTEVEKDIFDHILEDMTTRNYWSRMWTLQEFVLPREVYIFIGPYRLPWINMLDALCNHSFVHHEDDFWKHHQCSLVDSQDEFLPPDIVASSNVRNSHWFEYKDPHNWRASTWDSTFEEVAASRHCANPRDYVYAILGLCHDSRIVPDYEIPLPKLLLQTLFTEELFNVVRTGQVLFRRLDLTPSIVHDWCKGREEYAHRTWRCEREWFEDFTFVERNDRFTVLQLTCDGTKFLTVGNVDLDPATTRISRFREASIGIAWRIDPPLDPSLPERPVVIAAGYCLTENDDIEKKRPFLELMQIAFSTYTLDADYEKFPRTEGVPYRGLVVILGIDAFIFVLSSPSHTDRLSVPHRYRFSDWESRMKLTYPRLLDRALAGNPQSYERRSRRGSDSTQSSIDMQEDDTYATDIM